MTTKQLKHLETTLIAFIDAVTKKQAATTAELEALPKVALALVEIHKCCTAYENRTA